MITLIYIIKGGVNGRVLAGAIIDFIIELYLVIWLLGCVGVFK